MKLKKYTLNDLKSAISTSVSLREVLQKLNIKEAGGNYATLKRAINFYNLDTSHFTGKNLKGRKLPNRRKPIEHYLSKTVYTQSYKLKRYILEANLLTYECSNCNLQDWLSHPIPLELDHIDGDPSNNTLENLRLLCPNCHALTETYRGKNIKSP